MPFARKCAMFVVLFAALFISSLTLAQGGRPQRPTREPASPMPTLPDNARPTQGGGLQPTVTLPALARPTGTPPARPQPTLTMTFAGQIPATPAGDWLSSISVPDDMPDSAADVQAALQNANVPYDVTLENVPPSSETAYAAIVGFAEIYLGITPAPLYAAEFNTANAGTRPRRGSSTEMSAELESIVEQFPEELQTMLANASGIAYAGLMSNGLAVVYTGECTAAQCSISMDNLQFQITQESLGAYAVYISGTVTDANSAMAMVKAAYPALNSIPLAPTDVETGYAFTAVSGDMESASVIAYYAGTVAVGQYALVYAAVGVGQGYAEVVRDASR